MKTRINYAVLDKNGHQQTIMKQIESEEVITVPILDSAGKLPVIPKSMLKKRNFSEVVKDADFQSPLPRGMS